MENPIKNDVLNENTMMERGKFTANGYTFTVKPVYLGEEDAYLADLSISPIPITNNGKPDYDLGNDKKLGQWSIALFSKAVNTQEQKKHGRFYQLCSKIFRKKNYKYYSNKPAVQPFVKWIEQKVFYHGRKIRFYDLERKYNLSKADIERLFIYFHELSGF